jgi:hypothetical protein
MFHALGARTRHWNSGNRIGAAEETEVFAAACAADAHERVSKRARVHSPVADVALEHEQASLDLVSGNASCTNECSHHVILDRCPRHHLIQRQPRVLLNECWSPQDLDKLVVGHSALMTFYEHHRIFGFVLC